MKKLLSVSAVAIFAASGSAMAADPIVPGPAPVVPPVVDSSVVWDGFYIGLNAGYGWGEGEIEDPFGGPSLEDDIDGWLGGAQVGYNFSSGGMVFGVEADYQFANIVYSESAGGVSVDLGIESFGTVRGRVGADMGGFMPYLTAGLAFGQLGYDIDVAGGPSISDSEWSWGWAAGAGVEAMVADNVSLKAEYLYVDLREATFDIGGTDVDASAHAHTARVGFNFHF